MLKGWYKESGKWYYFKLETGKMVIGQQEVSLVNIITLTTLEQCKLAGNGTDGAYHYYQASGAMLKGWYKEAGKW